MTHCLIEKAADVHAFMKITACLMLYWKRFYISITTGLNAKTVTHVRSNK